MLDVLLTGSNFIGAFASAAGEERFRVSSRQDGRALEPDFVLATEFEIDRAARAAAAVFPKFAALTAEQRAAFLDEIASEVESLGEALLNRAHAESGLPLARLTGERGRTCAQLRMFAAVVREGSWVDARIDHAQPDRTPLPKPDIRRMLVPLGPVAVFGASNFPLAFSVAGGDTASALAAGCPVIVKAHPAHPGTSEMVAHAILAAAKSSGMPDGVFSMIHGGAEVGKSLVLSPSIEAVAFTGSKSAGRALFDLAAQRERPIPVFAEMGSLNPFFVLPGALAERSDEIAKGYADSLALGVGQFCTNPGVILGIRGAAFEAWLKQVAEHLAQVSAGTMLTDDICSRFEKGVAAWAEHQGLRTVLRGEGASAPSLFLSSASTFMSYKELKEELFGPAAIAIECDDLAAMLKAAKFLEGQLTATVQRADSDVESVRSLLPVLTRMAGRVVIDGYPTGVEVCPSMQHGGPYPATTDSRSTSVGTAAILRFGRPVAYQGLTDELLPPELQEANPRGLWRTVDGAFSR